MEGNTGQEKTPTTPWLAIRFGCCASRNDVEEDEGRRELRANGESEMRICYDQPQSIPQPRAESLYPRPSTSHSMSRHVSQWVSNSRDFASRASSRASMHTLTRPRRSQSKARPSIGRPTDFRHFDGPEGIQTMLDEAPMPVRRRRSFRPLELSIYLPDGRLSPLPDFSAAEWDSLPAELEMPTLAHIRERDSRTMSMSSNPSESSYLIQRKPVGTGSRRSSVQSQLSVRSSRALSETITAVPYMQDKAWSRPASVTSSTTSLQRSHTLSPNSLLSRLPSPSRSRSNTAPSRPGSVRRAKVDVEDAIRELNTIVEERRADAYRTSNYSPSFINRPPLSPSHHVPVIAPSMRMHVRSETLSDIGSAFSVPLTNKSLPTPPPPGSGTISRRTTGLTLVPPERTYSGPLTSNPITPPTPSIPTPTTPIQRIGAWIKRSLPSTPSSPNFLKSSRPTTPKTPPNAASFYKCESAPPPLPVSTSRPSSASSRTTSHARHASDDTATVTLISSYPSTPSLSMRSNSPSPSTDALPAPETPAQHRNVAVLRGTGKTRRIPAPLTLAKEKEMMVEAALGSARSVASTASSRSSRRSLKPPPSPNYGILRGMEISAVAPGVRQNLAPAVAPSSAVGLAF